MHTLYSFIIFENMTLQTKMIQTGRFDTKVVDRRVLHVQRRIDLETAPYQPVPARHARGARSKTRLQLQVRRSSGTTQEEEPHQPVSEIELCTGQRTREPFAGNCPILDCRTSNLKALFNNVFSLKIWAAWPHMMIIVSLIRCKNEALKNCTSKAPLSVSKKWK